MTRSEIKWLIRRTQPRLRALTIKRMVLLWALGRMWAGETFPSTHAEVVSRLNETIEAAAHRAQDSGFEGNAVDFLNAEARRVAVREQ